MCLGLMNPKSAANVGAVLRAAGCFSVDAVCYTGARYDRAKSFHTDTKNRVTTIPLRHVDCLPDAVENNSRIVAVEFVEGASPLTSFEHPHNAFYLFGPEDGSLTQSVIDRCDQVVYVPTVGCLNLAASVNVVLYDRLAKLWPNTAAGDDDLLIRNNRDCRNRLKLREKLHVSGGD